MPELPEVETIMRGLQKSVTGAEICDVVVRRDQLRWPIPDNFKSKLKYQHIHTLTRRGKYLLFNLTSGTIIVHLGMSGSLRLLNQNQPATTHDHLDLILTKDRDRNNFLFLADQTRCAQTKDLPKIESYFGHDPNQLILRYNDPRRFGAILWTEENVMEHRLLAQLGIEPLESGFTGDYLQSKLSCRRKSIKQLLMDNKIVVGIGNIYATEALFLAKINPKISGESLTAARCHKLIIAIKQILESAILHGGTTLKDFVNSEGKPGYFSQKLQVYGRAGLSCTRCTAILQSIILGQRNTTFCPSCQDK